MNKRRRTLYFKLIILILCLIIIIRIFTLILAKYESEATGNADLDIAYYLFKEDYQSMTLNLGSIIPKNNEYVYEFSIGNEDGDDTAEIDLTYDLTIRTTTNLPLTYSLYMNEDHDDQGATSIIVTNTTGQDADNTYFRTITTNTETLYFRNPTTNYYQLVVHFPVNDPNNNYFTKDYQDVIEAIEITVDSRQYTS